MKELRTHTRDPPRTPRAAYAAYAVYISMRTHAGGPAYAASHIRRICAVYSSVCSRVRNLWPMQATDLQQTCNRPATDLQHSSRYIVAYAVGLGTYGPCKQTPLLNSFEFCIRCHPLRAPSRIRQHTQHCQHMSACKPTPLLNSFVFYIRCHAL